LAIAPGCRLSMRKFIDESGFRNYPVAAFQQAVGTYDSDGRLASPEKRPDVIVCSWVLGGTSVALQLEIANAVSQGILVVFASGNADMGDETPHSGSGFAPFTSFNTEGASASAAYRLCPVAHPEVLSVGGVTKRLESGTPFSSADYTPVGAYFGSEAFVYPGGNVRNCPDVVGLTAPMPKSPLELPALIRTPTSVGSALDRKPDGGEPDDGWFKAAGTSMAAGQVAGVAALLIESVPGLKWKPASTKNVLTNSARYGESPPWDARVGHGVASAVDAMHWLKPEFTPRIRDDLDPRTPGTDSPDIVLLEPELDDPFRPIRRLDQGFKHLSGEDLEQSDPNGRHVFVRVQNHGRVEDSCRVTLAIVGAGGIDIAGDEVVTLAPGAFQVVGPFELTERPSGAFLVAEAIPTSMDSTLVSFTPNYDAPIIDQVKAEGFAVRGVKP